MSSEWNLPLKKQLRKASLFLDLGASPTPHGESLWTVCGLSGVQHPEQVQIEPSPFFWSCCSKLNSTLLNQSDQSRLPHTNTHFSCNLQPLVNADEKSVNHAACKRDVKQQPVRQRARKCSWRPTSPEGIPTSNINWLCLIYIESPSIFLALFCEKWKEQKKEGGFVSVSLYAGINHTSSMHTTKFTNVLIKQRK